MATAFAPGRVNLIGDHTDYTGGWVLPMAIQLGTTVAWTSGGPDVRLVSEVESEPAHVPLDVADPSRISPAWARYVAGVVAEVRPAVGGVGTVATTLPVGAGLSSSAALELSVALALGFVGPPAQLARLGQAAEQRASGVPCGVMDQLTSAAGVAGAALLIDCEIGTVSPVAVPDDAEVVAIHSGQARRLAGSAYAERRAQCERAVALVGSLRHPAAEVDSIEDPVVRRRARHVVSENGRVRAAAEALERDDLRTVGSLMYESHVSLRDDFEVSTPRLDGLVDDLMGRPGVFGARLTGAGFGGCAVALCRPGSLDRGWRLIPSAGARLVP